MKRIQVISHSFLANDPRVRRAVQAFVDDGWTVEGLFLDTPVREDRLRTWRVPIERKQGGVGRYAFEYGVFFVWTFVWVLLRSLRHRPDVVYVNSPPDVFSVAALPGKMFGAKVILDIHDPMPELFNAKGGGSKVAGRALEVQEKLGIAAANSLITVHEPLADVIRGRLPNAEFSIVMNVPDASDWPPLDRDLQSRTLVFTGTVARRYGVDDLIRAVSMLTEALPTLRLKIVGDGEDLDELVLLSHNLGVDNKVEFVGRVPYAEIRRFLDDAWLGVNVPKPDDLGTLSFSNKVVEWVSIGLPVLAARTSTMQKYFPEETLIYTEGGNVDAIASSICEIDTMTPAEIARRTAVAHQALDAIAWPVQRTELLRVVGRAAL